MRIEYHRTLIADRVRNEAFHRALAAVIEPGETTVADIGAGTGLLGLMAERLGAREVYLYEAADVAGVAARVLKANRARRCHLFPCHSTEMQDPPRADVVVSETLGNYPFEENIIETMNDALTRHLKPGGGVIPARVEQFVAPMVDDRFARELSAWDDAGFGIVLAPAKVMSLNNVYVRTIEPGMLLDGGGARIWDAIDFSRRNNPNRKGKAEWRLAAPAMIQGFATWWTADLGAGVTLSTAPGAPRTHWEQLYFPLLRALRGETGDSITVRIRSRSSMEAGTSLAWTASRRDRAGGVLDRQSLDLDRGWLP